MSEEERNGHRRSRDARFDRCNLRLGNYLIITDAKKTEKLYMEGLKESLPKSVRNQLQIKVVTDIATDKLVEKACSLRSKSSVYCDTWIVFDCDLVPNFDKIIKDAESKGIHVAWSNPCIEMWFFAYFNKTPNISDSTTCIRKFKNLCHSKMNKYEYHKEDKAIYKKLIRYGDEEQAIRCAKARYKSLQNPSKKCAKMVGVTTLYQLVEDIKSKDLS